MDFEVSFFFSFYLFSIIKKETRKGEKRMENKSTINNPRYESIPSILPSHLSSRKSYDKNIETKTTQRRSGKRKKERKEKKERENLATRFMIKERRGRIIVVAGSSASFIDNDSVDKRLSLV